MSDYYKRTNPVNVVDRSIFSRNFFLIVIFLTLFAIVHLVQRNYIKDMLFEISQMDFRINMLKDENSELQKDLHELSSNERIREQAMNVLKMVELKKPPEVLFIQDQFEEKKDIFSNLINQRNLIFKNPNDLINSTKE